MEKLTAIIPTFNEAHNIAFKKFGSTFPNPVVGCVIVKNNKIISKGVTNKSGRPHAEEIAMEMLTREMAMGYLQQSNQVIVTQIHLFTIHNFQYQQRAVAYAATMHLEELGRSISQTLS